MAEHQSDILKVVGSIPIVPTSRKEDADWELAKP